MIILTKKQYDEIRQHAINALPNEACGLLGGTNKAGVKTVEKVYLLENIDHSPEHFSMNPSEQFAAVKDMRLSGFELLGNFHSHPASPARPSYEDIRLAFDENISYLILSMMDRSNIALKSFLISEENVQAEEIIIKGE